MNAREVRNERVDWLLALLIVMLLAIVVLATGLASASRPKVPPGPETLVLTVGGSTIDYNDTAGSSVPFTLTGGFHNDASQLITQEVLGVNYTAVSNGRFNATGAWSGSAAPTTLSQSTYSFFVVGRDQTTNTYSNAVEINVTSTNPDSLFFNGTPLAITVGNNSNLTVSGHGAVNATYTVYGAWTYGYIESQFVVSTGTTNATGWFSFVDFIVYPWPHDANFGTLQVWEKVGTKSLGRTSVYVHTTNSQR